MAKNGKTYSITEAQLEDMIKKASEAGAEAYKKEQSQSTRRKVDRMLYKDQGSPGEIHVAQSVC